ncbi:MAG: hypothetical protein ACR2ID_03175 [Chthoniobacterales bacterium]
MHADLPPAEEQRIIIRERLRLLEIGYYIRAGMGAVFSLFMMIYVAMFLGMSFIPDSAWQNQSRHAAGTGSALQTPPPDAGPPAPGAAPPKALFRIMGCVFGFFVLLMWIFAAATAYAGRCIRQRRRRMFIYVVAGLNCIFVPYGTFLGVMTFLALASPAGRWEFEAQAAA